MREVAVVMMAVVMSMAAMARMGSRGSHSSSNRECRASSRRWNGSDTCSSRHVRCCRLSESCDYTAYMPPVCIAGTGRFIMLSMLDGWTPCCLLSSSAGLH